jgi:hypothetical protein
MPRSGVLAQAEAQQALLITVRGAVYVSDVAPWYVLVASRLRSPPIGDPLDPQCGPGSCVARPLDPLVWDQLPTFTPVLPDRALEPVLGQVSVVADD